MKRILAIGILMSAVSLLVACGGSSGTSDGAGGAPTTPVNSSSNDLIIDNGRGTSNNQDTETPQN